MFRLTEHWIPVNSGKEERPDFLVGAGEVGGGGVGRMSWFEKQKLRIYLVRKEEVYGDVA